MSTSWRTAGATARAAVALAWRASSAGVTALLGLSVVTALGPVATAWLTKVVLDRLVGGQGDLASLAGFAVGLAFVGLLTAVTPHLSRYVGAELGRGVGVRSRDELFAAVDRFVGLAPFESPPFVDRLRLAQRAGAGSPNGVLEGVVGIAAGLLGLVGFLGSLGLIWWWRPRRRSSPSSPSPGPARRPSGASDRSNAGSSSTSPCCPLWKRSRRSGCSAPDRCYGTGCWPNGGRPTPRCAGSTCASCARRPCSCC
jgi:hypothetical protein